MSSVKSPFAACYSEGITLLATKPNELKHGRRSDGEKLISKVFKVC